ncbi:hypothetical protein GCM10028775_35240 [Catellatospora paridis]
MDIAIFQVEDIDTRHPYVSLGGHLQDYLGRSDFVLTEAVVLGYPPLPLTTEPTLIGTKAEVNAMVERFDAPYIHFILSTMPRGGFSGGPAISEYGMALGVVTSSLMSGGSPAELGYMSVLTVDPTPPSRGRQ